MTYLSEREAIETDQFNCYINGQNDGRNLEEIEDLSTPYLQGYAEEAKKICEEMKKKNEHLESELNEIKKIIYRNLATIEELQKPQEFVEF